MPEGRNSCTPSCSPPGWCVPDFPLICPWLVYTCLPSCGPSFSPTTGLYMSNLSLTQSPQSAYTCPSPSQPLVCIPQPSFSLVSWFACPGFILVCPGLHIPASHGLLVHARSPSFFLAPRLMFVSHLTSLLGRMHCQLCACVCWSPLPGCTHWAFIHDCSAFSHAHLGSLGFVLVHLSFGVFIFRLPSLLFVSIADMVST